MTRAGRVTSVRASASPDSFHLAGGPGWRAFPPLSAAASGIRWERLPGQQYDQQRLVQPAAWVGWNWELWHLTDEAPGAVMALHSPGPPRPQGRQAPAIDSPAVIFIGLTGSSLLPR
jgi:hypothetical protein